MLGYQPQIRLKHCTREPHAPKMRSVPSTIYLDLAGFLVVVVCCVFLSEECCAVSKAQSLTRLLHLDPDHVDAAGTSSHAQATQQEVGFLDGVCPGLL